MIDSLIAFTQSGMGQAIGLIGLLLFPLYSAIYCTVLEDSENRSKIAEVFLVVLFVAGAIVAVDEYSFIKTIGKGIIYFFTMFIITGFLIDMMESK